MPKLFSFIFSITFITTPYLAKVKHPLQGGVSLWLPFYHSLSFFFSTFSFLSSLGKQHLFLLPSPEVHGGAPAARSGPLVDISGSQASAATGALAARSGALVNIGGA